MNTPRLADLFREREVPADEFLSRVGVRLYRAEECARVRRNKHGVAFALIFTALVTTLLIRK